MVSHNQSVDKENRVTLMIQCRQKNLLAFKKFYPDIFPLINRRLKNIKINVDERAGTLDLLEDGRSWYKGDSESYIGKEYRSYFSKNRRNLRLKSSIRPSFHNEYAYPRYFHRIANDIISHSPVTRENWVGEYHLPEFLPLVVVLGVGVGLHIEHMSERRVHRLVVVDASIEPLIASLYVINWEKIFLDRLEIMLPPITFVLGNQSDMPSMAPTLWGHLNRQHPVFPLLTLFYNHRGSEENELLIELIQENRGLHYLGWGYYDDEVNQWNQVFHNLLNKTKFLVKADRQLEGVPVVLVGSGPSLTGARIRQLQAIRSKVFVICCATALPVLYTHNIKPDCHFELESDYRLSLAAIEVITDSEYLRSIPFIGPIQLNPFMLKPFGEFRAILKSESGLTPLLAHAGQVIEGGSSNVVSFALAFAIQYGASEIRLFGFDCGMVEGGLHHSKETAYYDEEQGDHILKDATFFERLTQYVTSIDGRELVTTPQYLAAKKRVEERLMKARAGGTTLTVYNCSDGAVIDGSEWIAPDGDPMLSREVDLGRDFSESPIQALFTGSNAPFTDADVKEIIEIVIGQLSSTLTPLNTRLEALIQEHNTLISRGMLEKALVKFDLFCMWVVDWLEYVVKSMAETHSLLCGSIRHFLNIGATHCWAIEADADRVVFLTYWYLKIKEFIEGVSDHFQFLFLKEFSIHDDEWLRKSILDPE